MMRIDDETLMAYVDGELDGDDAGRVREQLERDPALAHRMQVFEDSARALRDALGPEIHTPASPALHALVAAPLRLAGAGRPTAARRPGWTRPPALALAASVLLAVGIGIGRLAGGPGDAATTGGRDLLAALESARGWSAGFEHTPSGQSFTARGGQGADSRIEPGAAFLDAGDHVCRSFRELAAGQDRQQGIACRRDDGSWQPVVVVAEATAGAAAGDDAGYRPASGGGKSSFERILEMRMTTAPFTAEEERALMANGWRLAR